MIKPDVGESSRDTFRCDGPADVEAVIEMIGASAKPGDRWVVEELLIGRERPPAQSWLGDHCAVETAVCDGRIRHYMITDKLPLTPPFRETGDVIPTSFDPGDQDLIRDLASSAIRALGVREGLLHTEIKLTPTGPAVIEVNGRLGGDLGRLLRHGSEFDPVRLALTVALGEPLDEEGPVRLDHPVFMYSVFPPMRRVTIRTLVGPSHFRRISGVWAVDRPARPGQALDWRRGTRDWIFAIWLDATDLAAIPRMLREVEEAAATCVEFDEAEGAARSVESGGGDHAVTVT